MEKRRTGSAPLIIAIAVLILPALYVGSYLALVKPYRPSGRSGMSVNEFLAQPRPLPNGMYPNYRWGGQRAESFYWPLEQIDRKVRPKTWQRSRVIFDDYRSLQIERNLGGDY